jgi:hypothetical protein
MFISPPAQSCAQESAEWGIWEDDQQAGYYDLVFAPLTL